MPFCHWSLDIASGFAPSPWEWRTAIGYDRKLFADVLDAFASSLLRHIRWRVKRLFGLASVSDAQVGAITFVQRHDSALRRLAARP